MTNKKRYHMDKQQAFQAAQQGYQQAKDIDVNPSSENYGAEAKRLKQEIDEAYQQIDNALEVASEHQRIELKQFQDDLDQMSKNIGE
jgi:hypothetical protein